MTLRSERYWTSLLEELRKLPKEVEWVEFKVNNSSKEMIGDAISSLSNSAVLVGKSFAYLVWGIEDISHQVVGTDFNPAIAKVGNEELENWLLQRLSPRLNFSFEVVKFENKNIVVLEIPAAYRHPVSFQNNEYIRVGSYTKKLKEFPEKARQLWRALDQTPFENQIALEDQDGQNVLSLLECSSYFSLQNLPLPDGHKAILSALESDDLLKVNDAGRYDITNLGAILFAKKFDSFPNLKRKAVRVIRYKGKMKIETIKEQVGVRGYADGFEGLIDYVTALLPSNEVIGKALRKDVPMYPDLALRELIANMLIHQDFFESGTGPVIEIFDDRMEIVNPGQPLIDTQRFLDSPPKSRNDKLAALMRRFGICEERGSGIDKVVFQTEFYQLPAPLFESPPGFTKVILFAHKEFSEMDKADRIRACYLHCCLQHVNQEKMTNKSLRDRFGIEESKGSAISKIIKATQSEGLILRSSSSNSQRDTFYVPFWSVSGEELT
jgi:predicted HTH transcriptional regulator